MVTPDKKPSTVHLFEIPADISEFKDAQIQAWAKKAYEQWAEHVHDYIAPILKGETAKEVNGDKP